MSRGKKHINYKNERVLLSDVLPYEVPPFFSNRSLYNFVMSVGLSMVQISTDKYRARFKNGLPESTHGLIKLLLGLNRESSVNVETEYSFINCKKLSSIPFDFRISHNDTFRELSVIHPMNQLLVVDFYNTFKSELIYYCNLSKFSLRKPSKVASIRYFKDSTFKRKKAKDSEFEIIETSEKEYSSLKTFFAYKEYSNIYKFYESKYFHLAEKRFDKLLKFDISRCFDSIYTHSLPWAIFNKKIIKDNLPKNGMGPSFDKLMQRLNYNETNGIVIGPEFSRIFAEIILQRVDIEVEKELHAKSLTYKKHYDVFRYVDDYFVFFNDEKFKDIIFSTYQLKLKEYNLFLNSSKTENFSKPIITNITQAKENIRILIERSLFFSFDNQDYKETLVIGYKKASDVITNYKSILKTTSTTYKDLQNYFLATIFNKTKGLINKYQKTQKDIISDHFKIENLESLLSKEDISGTKKEDIEVEKAKVEERIEALKKTYKKYHFSVIRKVVEIIDLSFFIYTVLPRVSYSIKLCHILFRIVDFIKNQERTKKRFNQKASTKELLEIIPIGFTFDQKHLVFKHVFEGVSVVLEKARNVDYSEIETLYIIAILNELGSDYKLPEPLLKEHFKITEGGELSYFTLMSILHNIKRDSSYSGIRKILRDTIKRKLAEFDSKKAEDVLLVIDSLNCPYVAETETEVDKFRIEILEKIKFFNDATSEKDKTKMINELMYSKANLFVEWEDADLGLELNTKRGHDVY